MTITLQLLKCIRCGQPLAATEEEVAWACANCGQGQQLAEQGLAPLTITWAQPKPHAQGPNAQGVVWWPAWVFAGTVKFTQRESYGGQNRPDKLWDTPRRFCIPAYPLTLDDLLHWATQLTRLPSLPTAGPALNVVRQCTLHPVDAREMVEFVVLSVEAQQNDKLKRANFALALNEPELWVLPFANGQPAWVG